MPVPEIKETVQDLEYVIQKLQVLSDSFINLKNEELGGHIKHLMNILESILWGLSHENH